MNLLFRPFVQRRFGGWLLGVCASLARVTGIRPIAFRTAALLALYFYPLGTLALYVGLFLTLRLLAGVFDRRPVDDRYLDAPTIDAARGHDMASLEGLSSNYAAMERQLADLEAEALSSDALTRARFRNAGLQ